MALDAQKALQLSALLAMTAQQFAVDNPGQQSLAQNLLGSAQAGIQAEALKKAKKEEEKKEKGIFGSKIGSLIGSAALAAIPGVGPFASAALGAAGGVAGGALGGAVAGGKASGSDLLTAGLSGGMNAYQYGKSSEFAQPQNDAAARPLTETLATKSTIPPVSVMPSNPTGIYPTSPKAGFNAGMAPVQASTVQNVANAQPMGYGQRFLGNMAQGLGIQQKPKVTRNPDGSVDYWG